MLSEVKENVSLSSLIQNLELMMDLGQLTKIR